MLKNAPTQLLTDAPARSSTNTPNNLALPDLVKLPISSSDNLLQPISGNISSLSIDNSSSSTPGKFSTPFTDTHVTTNRAGASPAPTVVAIGNIVGAYKSLVYKKILDSFKKKYPNTLIGKIWQRNYYEHIIRNNKSYDDIYNYIKSNPKNWDSDSLKP